ncbi:MAG TPA: hypothetical protein ENK86_04830 [Campylobacterales bacterium]|nr:hypothetical protein [Campylobacterales bacterium]
MKKLVIYCLLSVLPLFAVAKETYQEATQACEAYNNMKHSKNTNNVTLEVGKEYRILDHKKGQILTLVKGEHIAQRWVDENCFEPQGLAEKLVNALNKKSETSSNIASKKTSKQNLLAISWQNAFCENYKYKKECKSLERDDFAASHFVLHGLWPQPRNNQYCNVSKKAISTDKNKQWYRLEKLDLSYETREALGEKMPGYHSYLHRHEWVKHGTCYGTGADKYYQDSLALLEQLNASKIQTFFAQKQGKTVHLKEIRKLFDEVFEQGAGEHVTMNCRNGLITELWLHLGSGSDKLGELLSRGQTPKSRCFKGEIDAYGY